MYGPGMHETGIRALRRERGLTQLDLAMAAEVTPATIYRLERGDRSSDATRRRVARALGVPVEELSVHNDDSATAGASRG